MDLECWNDEIAAHRAWLKSFDNWHGKTWEQRLAADPEAAVVEACTRHVLAEHVRAVEPAEDPARGGPDFYCSQEGGYFYVESTCIKESAVTKKTALPPAPQGPTWYRPLTPSIRGECANKAKQCSQRGDAACLLGIGVLHAAASDVCFRNLFVEQVLTSEPTMTVPINTRTGQPLGEDCQTTDLRESAFLRPSQSEEGNLESARQSISGLLLCGFGTRPPTVKGVLHVEAARPFDRALLPDIPFCRLKDSYRQGVFEVEWV